MERAVLLTVLCLAVAFLPASSALAIKRPRREVGSWSGQSLCRVGAICQFQAYDRDSLAILDLITTCRCPRNTQCMATHNNLATAVINLRCLGAPALSQL